MGAGEPGSRSRSRRNFARIAASIAMIVVSVAVAVWWAARPAAPGAFYDPPAAIPSEPGILIRVEPFAEAVPAGARGWRILYSTTRRDGVPAIASAIVVAPLGSGRRPVVAWAHGTTGVVAGCAPSVTGKPFAHVPAFADIVREGWVYVGTDYVGLGTAGGHAYLVGEEAARAVLDSVRAARRLPDLELRDRVVVWGHSQGGNTALWTGILAPTLAPDVNLVGVAALAPASDLRALVTTAKSSLFGKIVSAYLMKAYGEAYPDVDPEALVAPLLRPVVADIAGRCAGGLETLVSVAETFLLPKGGLFRVDPIEGPLGARLEQNTPRRQIGVPVLIAQGEADDLVSPVVQAGYVTERCRAGQSIDYRTHAGRDHLSLVAPSSPAGSDLVAWTSDRFADRPVGAGCLRP